MSILSVFCVDSSSVVSTLVVMSTVSIESTV